MTATPADSADRQAPDQTARTIPAVAPASLDLPAFDMMVAGPPQVAMVLASPHSGAAYPADFLAASRLDLGLLRRAEDCHVDRLFAPAARLIGAPMLRALFPRCFVDVNREPYELDPSMFDDALPDYVNSRSPRVVNGLGTVARIVAHGHDIYRHKLRFAEVEQRLERYYRPYHTALQDLLDQTQALYGRVVLVDCHSMPSLHAGTRRRGLVPMPDFVLGDFFGSACAPAVTAAAEATLQAHGHNVVRNTPYAGGYITRHYGQPRKGVHVLQVEVNRALYMDEDSLQPLPGQFERMAETLTHMVRAIAELPASKLAMLPNEAGKSSITALGIGPSRVR